MSYLSIIVLAFALSIDACLVSFSYGLAFRENRVKNALLLALFTGFFQGFMPLAGYFLTSFVQTFIQPYAPIIIFLIFTYLGVKFIIEAFRKKEQKVLCLGLKCLFLVGIATSIDAFSAGISLALCGNTIIKPSLLITGVTFINSIAGFELGGKLQHLPTRILEILAGSLLVILGLRALLQFYSF